MPTDIGWHGRLPLEYTQPIGGPMRNMSYRVNLKQVKIDVDYIRENYPDDYVLQSFADTVEKWGGIIKLAEELNLSPEDMDVNVQNDLVDATIFGDTNKTYLASRPHASLTGRAKP